MDLKNPGWMYLKAVMFLVVGVACFGLVLLNNPTITTATCLVLMIWAFARTYYFAFYVIEKYVDGKYKFSGLLSFFQYIAGRKRRSRSESSKGVDYYSGH